MSTTLLRGQMRSAKISAAVVAGLIVALGVAMPAYAATIQYASGVGVGPSYPVSSPQGTHTGGRAQISVENSAVFQHIRTVNQGGVTDQASASAYGTNVSMVHPARTLSRSQCYWTDTTGNQGPQYLTCWRYTP